MPQGHLCSTRLISFSVPCLPHRCLVALGLCLSHIPFLCHLEVCHVPIRRARRWGAHSGCACAESAEGPQEDVWGEDACKIGDILTAQLPHMQPYIRLCSCQLNWATDQQKTGRGPRLQGVCQSEEPRLSQAPAPQGAICRQPVCDARDPKANRGEVSAAQGGGAGLIQWVWLGPWGWAWRRDQR